MIQDALTLYRELPGSEERVANVQHDLSVMYARQGKTAQSKEEARKALAIIVKLKGKKTWLS